MNQPFWNSDHFESFDGVAIATRNTKVSYSDLNKMVRDYAGFLSDQGLKNQLAFLPMVSDIDSVVRYLACLRSSIVPLLLPKRANYLKKFRFVQTQKKLKISLKNMGQLFFLIEIRNFLMIIPGLMKL